MSMENQFKYKLELEGKDYGKHEGSNSEYVAHVPFKETNFFKSIEEAMDALILKDLRSFEEMSESVSHSKYHEIASLHSVENDELLLQVIRISFSDSPDAAPAAGIYFSFDDRTTKEFEDLTGFDFTGFSNYDPDFPFLLLGSYSYEFQSGFEIAIDQIIADWENSLKYYELERDFNEDDWKYKVEIVENGFGKKLSQEIKRYHFHNLPSAARSLFKIDIKRLDKDLAEGLEEKSWISEASLKERRERPVVNLVAVKHPDSSEKVAEPGIHLKFSASIQEFEERADIDLSGLANYGDDDNYLLLANYYIDPEYNNNDYLHYSDLLPHPGYTRLLIQIDDEKRRGIDVQETSPFVLRVIWEKPVLDGKVSYSTAEQMNKETPYNSIEEGLTALLNLETHFFDQQSVNEMQYPFYIKRAEIIDTNKNSVVISKYQKMGDSGKGMYMSFDNNDESLALLIALDSAFKKRFENRSTNPSTDAAIGRKRIGSDRSVLPPGQSGPKL